MSRTTEHERGAALLEVLIALALTALMAAALTGVTGFGLTTVERAQASSAHASTAVLDRRSLTEPLVRLAAPQGSVPALIGTADALIWRSTATATPGSRGANVWKLTLRDRTLSNCRGINGADCTPGRTLGAKNVRIAFADAGGVWQEVWDDITSPSLIRIMLDDTVIYVSPRHIGALR